MTATQPDLGELFRHLINDRIGRHAARIVDVLCDPQTVLPVSVEVRTANFTYTVTISYDRRNRRLMIGTGVSAPPFMLGEPGPMVDFPGPPDGWSALERFRAADHLDRTFRGHDAKFDSQIP